MSTIAEGAVARKERRIKKQDVRDIYGEMGKEIKEGLNFNEFLSVMTTRMVKQLLFRVLATLKTRFSKSSNFSTKTISTKSHSRTWRESLVKLERKFLMKSSRKCWRKLIEMGTACWTLKNSTELWEEEGILWMISIATMSDFIFAHYLYKIHLLNH